MSPNTATSGNGKLRFAQVGWTQGTTERDYAVMMLVGQWLTKNAPDFHKRRWQHIPFSLPENDFLTNKDAFDVVVTHCIFDPPNPTELIEKLPQLRTQVSPLHSHQNWIARLASTNAQYIVLVEAVEGLEHLPSCLSGWHISEIPGYKRVHLDPWFAVFQPASA